MDIHRKCFSNIDEGTRSTLKDMKTLRDQLVSSTVELQF